ncbi:MAG TPA: hypothetical protein VNC11_06060 [Gemmatimonadaceae bacterium]|nr:hypothetical protein [Gemmatimonadaceae bacterium]
MTQKKDLGALLRDNMPDYEAPQSVRDWVREHAPADDVSVSALSDRRRSIRSLTPYLYAAGIALAFLGGWLSRTTIQSRTESGGGDALVAELVDNHVRSLIGDHLTDVQSTDQHTVKPWFAGKTDFAPRVVDLASQGFPLLGGRVDYVRGHTTAALVYGRRKHIVNLFIWPEGADAQVTARSFHGYSLLHWVSSGLSQWAVTDAAPGELATFRQVYERATSGL